MIDVRDLSCRLPSGRLLLEQLSFSVPQGAFLAVLGENGAGKTTLLDTLMGFRRRTAGQLSVMQADPDTDPWQTRQRIAYLSEKIDMPGDWQGREYLAFHRPFYGHYDRAEEERLMRAFGASYGFDFTTAFVPWTWVLYYAGLVATFGLFIEYTIWSTLEMERISRYVPQGSLLWAYVKVFAVPFALLFLVLQPAWTNLLLTSTYPELQDALTSGHFSWISMAYHVAAPEIVFPIMTAAVPVLFARNARKWCVTG